MNKTSPSSLSGSPKFLPPPPSQAGLPSLGPLGSLSLKSAKWERRLTATPPPHRHQLHRRLPPSSAPILPPQGYKKHHRTSLSIFPLPPELSAPSFALPALLSLSLSLSPHYSSSISDRTPPPPPPPPSRATATVGFAAQCSTPASTPSPQTIP